MKVNLLTNKAYKNLSKNQKFKTYTKPNNTNFKVSYIKNNIPFKGKKEYHEEDIKIVKKYLNCKDNSWQETVFQDKYEEMKKYKIHWEVPAHNSRGKVDADLNEPVTRVIVGVYSLGLSELVIQGIRHGYKKEIKEWIQNLNLIKSDLQSAKLNEEAMEAKKAKQNSQIELEYIAAINNVKENELYPKLLDKIQARREGMDVEVPNCVMITHKDEKINSDLINWCLKQANAITYRIDSCLDDDFDLYEFLEKAEESYQKTGKWNLIYIKDMDKAINRNEVDDSFISAMKAIMCSTANDYHSTLIFSSTVPGELDHIAIESNRVTPINVDNIKTIEQLQQDAAQKRLSGYSYPTDYPISAINDMLSLVSNNKTRYKLYFDSTSKELNETREFIEKRLQTQDLQRYKQILKKACENAWYIV